MKHHTKTLGDLGVLKAQVDLFEKGYIVAVPLTEHSPFDLIAYKDHKCRTIQVKTRNVNSRGTLQIQFSSCWADKNGTHTVSVDKDAIDVYCIYCPQTDECYYFDPKQFNKTLTLRVNPPKNNQKAKVHLANDYKAL